jgi:uncharacterized protein
VDSDSPLTFKVLERIADVAADAWNQVVGPAQPPVLRHEWLLAFEASGCATEERGWQAQHLTAWRGKRLVGVAPAWRKTHSMGEYIYDFGWANGAQALGVSYYPKLVVGAPLSPVTAKRFCAAEGEDEAALRGAMLEQLVAHAKRTHCSSIHILYPPAAEADALAAKSSFFRRSSMQFHWHNEGFATYDDYLKRFDAKRRHQLRRERGAAATQGITIRTVRSHELTDKHAELAWRFYESTAAGHSWGPVQLNEDFFHRAFDGVRDSVELVVAERGKKVVAGAFNLYTATRLYGRYWGAFEDVPFLHFHVCLYHSIDDCIQRGLKVFEPGAGGEHKVSRGFVPTEIHSVHQAFDGRLHKALVAASQREAVQVKAVVAQGPTLAGLKPL